MEILHIKDLSFTYPGGDKKALENIDLTINAGEFIVVCGESGCGKTTLLKMMKKELIPAGEKIGDVIYNGVSLDELDGRTSACEIGFVLQNPDSQAVTDKVWQELSFGLENLGMPTQMIRRRTGEMASYFGIGEWYHKKINELSGGQKQLLNLASIMAMSPKVLILDEPTSQLDPVAAADFILTLQKLNRELSLTIIIVEHRLEEVLPIADKVVVMENGKIIRCDKPREVCTSLKGQRLMSGMPSSVRIHNALEAEDICPLTVKEGRLFLGNNYTNSIDSLDISEYTPSPVKTVECKNTWLRYERDLPDILRSVDLTVYENESFFILGANGAGKTTLLRAIAGVRKPYRGSIKIYGKKIKEYSGGSLYRNMIALLPQNPQDVFLKSTVRDDFSEICKVMGYGKEQISLEIKKTVDELGIVHLLERHPYDLSGGEQQKCALAKLLLLKPRILLLDEPTKGIDAYSKHTLSDILKRLKADGITIIAVTHDVEFAAENADRCALFFDGGIISCDTPFAFFSDNNFYTTAASRISRHLFKNAVTCDDVIKLCSMPENKKENVVEKCNE